MSVEVGEAALVTGHYEPTGHRLTDMILSACAGLPFAGYEGEIEPTDPERKWCHAVLAGLPLPDFDYSGLSGYELTHAVFYATDFARRPRSIPEALAVVQDALEGETDHEMLIELGACFIGLGEECPADLVAIAREHEHEETHRGTSARMLLARL